MNKMAEADKELGGFNSELMEKGTTMNAMVSMNDLDAVKVTMYELNADEIDMVSGAGSLGDVLGSLGTLFGGVPASAAFNAAVVGLNSALTSLSSGDLYTRLITPVTAVLNGLAAGLSTASAVLSFVPFGSAGLSAVASSLVSAATQSINNMLHGKPPVSIGF